MALSDERIDELALMIANRSKQLAEAGLVQESPGWDMDPGERLAHLIATRVARAKAEEAAEIASWQGTNIIDASARFTAGR